jgi:hypothetical protein
MCIYPQNAIGVLTDIYLLFRDAVAAGPTLSDFSDAHCWGTASDSPVAFQRFSYSLGLDL